MHINAENKDMQYSILLWRHLGEREQMRWILHRVVPHINLRVNFARKTAEIPIMSGHTSGNNLDGARHSKVEP